MRDALRASIDAEVATALRWSRRLRDARARTKASTAGGEEGECKGEGEEAALLPALEAAVLAAELGAANSGARLRSLQSYVETAEAELSQHEENSTKARAVLPGAARELATLALTFSEDGQQGEAAGLFAHSLTILEAAFGSAQPELAAFKSEVQRVVDSGAAAQNGQTGQRQGASGGLGGGLRVRPDFDA